MARGWESKAVESQQADREADRMPPRDVEPTGRLAHRQTLQLARQRALAEIQLACRPAHRAMLESTIAELDRQLEAVGTRHPK